MKVFNIENACAGKLTLITVKNDSMYFIETEHETVCFSIGNEVLLASGKMGYAVFDTVKSVNLDNQSIELAEYGHIKLKDWEYFARV